MRVASQSVPPPALYALQTALLEDILNGEPMGRTLERLVLSIEQLAPGLVASVLLVQGDRLRLAAAPHLPDGYNRLVDGVPVGEGFGSCGTAAHRRAVVVVTDIQNDPLWKNYRDPAGRYGLGSCWSAPIFSKVHEVVGTFALYYREPRRPHPDELALIQQFSALAGLCIEHHRMEERCRDSEEGFRDVVDDLDAIVWEADESGRRFTFVSPRAEALLGYPVRRWLDEPDFWERILHPEDREATVRRAREAAHDGRSYEAEYRAIAADGRVLWLRELVYARADPRAQRRRLRGVMVNISRQREAEQERELLLQRLLDEQRLLRAVVDQMPEGVVVVEAPGGRLLLANERAGELVGVRMTPAPGRAEVPVCAGPARPAQATLADAWPPIGRALRTGEVVLAEEVDVLACDGLGRTVNVSAAPVRDRHGRVVAAVAILCDVTERKRAEVARRLLADAGSTIGSSLDPGQILASVASLGVAGLADWCAVFTRSDEGALDCAALGLRDPSKRPLQAELARLLPQPGGTPFLITEVLASGQARLFPSVTTDACHPGAVRPDLLRVLRALGTESALAVPLRVQGAVIGAIAYVSARPDRRYGDDDLALAEELGRRASLALENARLYREARDAARHREEFLSIAAHELKTPLAGLQMAVEALVALIDKSRLDPGLLRGRAHAGQRQMIRLAGLIDDLMDVSTIRAGRLELDPRPVDLVETVHKVISRFRDELLAKSIDVLVHAPTPVEGPWDLPRLEQVIAHLLSNAIKYGKRLPVRVVVQSAGDKAVLRVEDQGMGMTAEVTRRLFRPFERGVAPGHYGGLGLGLYLTDQIVRAHGGRVSVESAPGQGSAFTVELPREEVD